VRGFLYRCHRQVQAAAGVCMLSLRSRISGRSSSLFALTASAAAFMTAQSAAQVSHVDRTVLAELPYIAVTTCVDELLRINGHLVLCNDYSYPYHYGAAVLLAEKWTANDRLVVSYKLCLENSSGRCLRVELLKRQ
jgi:hypothetical protein